MARPKDNTMLDSINAVELYRSGLRVSDISIESGKHYQTVVRYLQDKGVEIKGKFGNRHNKVCLICNYKFVGKAHQKYCSRNCSNENDNSRHKNDLGRYLVDKAKQNARMRGRRGVCIEVTLTSDQILRKLKDQNYKCALTGIEMVTPVKGKALKGYSVDRIKPGGDYTYENIQIICLGVQYLKSDFTQKETIDFLSLLKTKK